MVSSVNSHTNATRIGWHLWKIDLRFAPGLPRGWERTHRSENDVVAFPPEVRFPAGLLTGSVTASQKNCGVVVHTLKAGLQRASEARQLGESPDRSG